MKSTPHVCEVTEIKHAKTLLESIEAIIKNPVLEKPKDVRKLKEIRTRLKRAIRKMEKK